jgi:vitamin-K-epoxide reductase (warfarin-sensitive)
MRTAVSASPGHSTAASQFPSRSDRGLLVAVAMLAVAGIIISAVSLQRHYAKSASQFCDIGEKFNCDIVNRSEYSSLMGIPVAGIGVVGYALVLVLATAYRSHAKTPLRLLLASSAGLAFALYLTYVEGHILDTWCLLCLSSLAMIVLITLLAALVKLRAQSS